MQFQKKNKSKSISKREKLVFQWTIANSFESHAIGFNIPANKCIHAIYGNSRLKLQNFTKLSWLEATKDLVWWVDVNRTRQDAAERNHQEFIRFWTTLAPLFNCYMLPYCPICL